MIKIIFVLLLAVTTANAQVDQLLDFSKNKERICNTTKYDTLAFYVGQRVWVCDEKCFIGQVTAVDCGSYYSVEVCVPSIGTYLFTRDGMLEWQSEAVLLTFYEKIGFGRTMKND